MRDKSVAVVNPNLEFLYDNLGVKSGVVLEGSSRSGKTWSSVDFIIYLCSTVEKNATINIIKETYNSFKTTLYDDFNRRLPQFGIVSPFENRQEVRQFHLFGNKINLLGADSDTVLHGAGCDYVYYNEMLDIQQKVFDQTEMRCRKYWWADYNPKFTEHWFFDKVTRRSDVGFLKTTFIDNPHISKQEKRKILSYDPNVQKNIQEGTADDYMWNVYGLGLRSAPEGLIFQHVKWIERFPEYCEKVFYGVDFGYTNSPTVIVKVGVSGNKLFADCLFYQPTPSFNELEPALAKFIGKDFEAWCDPSGDSGARLYISNAAQKGYKVFAANTYPGSIKDGISLLKKFDIHLVNNKDVEKEQSNYKYREIHGIRLDDPIDNHNHFWDALRIAALSKLTNYVI